MSKPCRAKIRIYAFCESVNQIFIADHAALAWAEWAEVVGVTFGHTFKLDPNAILSAGHLHDFIILDRSVSPNYTEAGTVKSMKVWLRTIAQPGVCALSFNDGSRLGLAFVKAAQSVMMDVFVIQDGYLGHETNFRTSGYKVFNRIHAALLHDETRLSAAIAEPRVTKTYKKHCATTKIGASRNCRYFVRGDDVKIKICIVHGLVPDQVEVVGSVHGAIRTGAPQSKTRAPRKERKSVLYIGQCHSLHGKIKKDDWLALASKIFSQLGRVEADIHYKFHPSDPHEMREALKRFIPDSISIAPDGILTQDCFQDFDFVLSENSSCLLDALRAGCNVVIHDVPDLPERLPRIADEKVYVVETSDLAGGLSAVLSGKRTANTIGIPLSKIERETIPDFFGHLGSRIRRTVIGHVNATPAFSLKDRALEVAGVLAPSIPELVRNSGIHGAYFKYLGDADVLDAHLQASGHKNIIPVLRGLLGRSWAEEMAEALPEFALRFNEPELAFVGSTLQSRSLDVQRQVLGSLLKSKQAHNHLSLSYAATAPGLSFEQRFAYVLDDKGKNCLDAPYYIARIMLQGQADMGAKPGIATAARMLRASEELTVQLAGQLVVLYFDEKVLSMEDAVIVLAQNETKRPYTFVTDLISMLIADRPDDLKSDALVEAIWGRTDTEAEENQLIGDEISYSCKLAEDIARNATSVSQTTFAAGMLAEVLARKPKSRRAQAASGVIGAIHDLSPIIASSQAMEKSND